MAKGDFLYGLCEVGPDLPFKRGLSAKENIRATCLSGLAYTMASEAVASERIEDQRASGFVECWDATAAASMSIKQAIKTDRGNRQKGSLAGNSLLAHRRGRKPSAISPPLRGAP